MRKVVAFILLVFMLFIGYVWWKHGISPVNSKDTSEQVFVVERGAGIREISNNLKKQGLISDPIVLFLLIKKEGKDNAIQAGDYRLSPSMSLQQILDSLSHGTLDIWITTPEGLRAEEIADILQKNIPSYKESWRAELIKNEGYLFPDTYLIPRNADIVTIISIMRNNFDKKIEKAGISDNPNLQEIIIIASMIEREALRDEEKPFISSVIANRLRDGVALDIDATLQYVKGKRNGKWWTVPTGEDRRVYSPYNTYMNPGLPPGPISNPGIEAITAAANPATSGYYYYIHDAKGNVHFSKTLEEHQANINKYL